MPPKSRGVWLSLALSLVDLLVEQEKGSADLEERRRSILMKFGTETKVFSCALAFGVGTLSSEYSEEGVSVGQRTIRSATDK